MQPWIIEKIKEKEREGEEKKRVQPHLPAPEPPQTRPETRDDPARGSMIVDFEL